MRWDEPALPSATLGAPPGRPPAAARATPGSGGMRGVIVPPEIRRRQMGVVRPAPGSADAADRIRLALGKGQRKLLDAQRKLQSSADSVRANVANVRAGQTSTRFRPPSLAR